MQTPDKQAIIQNVPQGPVRQKQPIFVNVEPVFQTPFKRQRVIEDEVSIISPKEREHRVNRRLFF